MVLRFSLRRCFLGLLGVTCFLFLVVNVHQRELWARSLAAVAQHDQQQVSPASAGDAVRGHAGPALVANTHTDTQLEQQTRLGGEQEEGGVSSRMALFTLQAEPRLRPWFMQGGERRPEPAPVNKKSGRRIARLWPGEDLESDRITDQLMFLPPKPKAGEAERSASENEVSTSRLKKIVLYNGLNSWAPLKAGRESFLNAKCPVDTCTISTNKGDVIDADAVLFKDHFPTQSQPWRRPSYQVWILYFLECPYHTQHVKFGDVFNWTATYRRDSDLVAPYERWAYFDESVKRQPPGSPAASINYAANKTRQVAWFVSNCGARNGRLQYARELSKYISVDVFGACGTKLCPRTTASKCFEMLDREYKFYLAFENSNCRDYITEKFFVNGLGHNILPIVMGARPEDYAKSAPYKSYIHVDEFASPKELASYLHRLDVDDELYNEYFRWKGTGEFINTYFFCRVCAMLHDPEAPRKNYRDVNEWWRGTGVCISGSWRQHRPLQRQHTPWIKRNN